MMQKTIIQISFILINWAMAVYQAYRFDTLQKRIKHWIWAIWYGLLVAATWPIHRDTLLIMAITTLHLTLFNPLLNYNRKPRRAFFYTHPEDPQGDFLDKIWSNAYPAVWCASLFFYITVNIFLYGSA